MKTIWRILLPGALLFASLAPAAEKAAKTAPPAAPGASKKTASKPPPRPNQCLMCHGNADVWEGERLRLYVTEAAVAGDIHWKKGLRCADCHGGNSDTEEVNEAHAAEDGFHNLRASPKDFTQPPDPVKVVELCGKCHANIEYMRRYRPSPRVDQLAEYWTSGHGKRLKATGDPQVAICISCHNVPHGSGNDKIKHGIRAVDDLESPVYRTNVAKTCAKCHADKKRMAGYQYNGRPLGCSEYEDWLASVHAEALLKKDDLSAPTCNNCHGNHGAVPPAVGSVANACGACHGKIAGLFADTRMKHGFLEANLPGCVTCHSNHRILAPSDKMVGMVPGAVCVRCHQTGKHGATLAGAQVARTIRSGFDRLREEIRRADTTLALAERLGMEVSQPKFELRDAVSALTNARTVMHSFQVKPVEEALAEGQTVVAKVQHQADRALEQHHFRRIWLAGSLVPILIVIGLLLLYIRRLPA
jgi:predicted CXXCH cytochrome family protein